MLRRGLNYVTENVVPSQKKLKELYAVYIKGESGTFVCDICFERRYEMYHVQLNSCEHGACLDCLANYIDNRLNQSEVEFSCPFNDDCAKIDENSLELVVNRGGVELREKLEAQRLRNALLSLTDIMECPSEECSNIVETEHKLVESQFADPKYRGPLKTTVLRVMRFHPAKKYKFKAGEDMRKFTCGNCFKSYCFVCKRSWSRGQHSHDQISCEAYDRKLHNWGKREDKRERETKNHIAKFSTGKNKIYTSCPNCKRQIERNGKAQQHSV